MRTLDLHPGGELLYAMTAVDPPQIAFMKKAGMPLSQELRITFYRGRAAPPAGVRPRLRLTKIRKLLVRQGVEIAYPTLHRFAVLELQFGKTATTIPVLDGEPGQELQLDTGWVGRLTLPEPKWRRFRAWIFTAVRSRHRFVYTTCEETTARAIEACEASWEFS